MNNEKINLSVNCGVSAGDGSDCGYLYKSRKNCFSDIVYYVWNLFLPFCNETDCGICFSDLYEKQSWLQEMVVSGEKVGEQILQKNKCPEMEAFHADIWNQFIRCGKTPASTGGEYNKLVSVAGVNPLSDKRAAGALNVQWTFA